MQDLKQFKKNIFSQFGEDGIIEEILKRLNKFTDKQCCEFGAWDGIYLSNTCALIKNHNYEAILIEPNKKKYNELCENFPEKKIIKLNKFVEIEGINSLDNILKEKKFNLDFDFLSIDVDSIDYHIFNSLEIYHPKIISIEYNPTIPNEVLFTQKRDGSNQGSSARSIIELALKKKYHPICATVTNLFIIHNDYKHYVVGDKSYKINELIDDSAIKNFIFYGYDGTILTSKDIKLPWHNFPIKDLNVLNKFLRKYPRDYNLFEKIIFQIYRKIKIFLDRF